MKKLLALALIGVFAFTGCSLTEKATEKVAEELTEKAIEAGTGTDVEIDVDGEEYNVTTDLGEEISIGTDVELSDDFPSDVPVYSDSKVTASYSSDAYYTATLLSTDDFDTIKEYYKSAIESEGWTIDSTSNLNLGGQSTTYLCSKDNSTRNLTVGIYAYEESDEVTISLSVN